jgi:hypothetical protein
MKRSTESPTPLTPLTDLKGIGPAKASRIQQALQIEWAEALVGLDIEEIFQKLAETGTQIPRREIQQWLIQALRLVKAQESETSSQGEEPSDMPKGDDRAFPTADSSPAQGPTGTFEIAPVGNQLHIKTMVEGPTATELTTDDPQTLYQWIQARLSSKPAEEIPAATSALPLWRIDITKVEIVPLSETDPHLPSTAHDYLARGVPFVIGVNFQITGQGEGCHPTPNTAVAQFSIRNRLTGETIPIGTAQGCIHRLDAAHLQSPPTSLTNPGIYQLQTVIQLQGQETVSGYRELQFIKVL